MTNFTTFVEGTDAFKNHTNGVFILQPDDMAMPFDALVAGFSVESDSPTDLHVKIAMHEAVALGLGHRNFVLSPLEIRPLPVDCSTLVTAIHADNVAAGWWNDLKTGESTLHTRNRPEMLMLAISELGEAAGALDGGMDDKLPHLPMYDVELADFVIRQFDQIGAEVSCGHPMPDWGRSDDVWAAIHAPSIGELKAMARSERLMALVMSTSAAMEHYRKGRTSNYIQQMSESALIAFTIAAVEGIDLLSIIEQKRSFNRTREDHKITNRLKDGGKQF